MSSFDSAWTNYGERKRSSEGTGCDGAAVDSEPFPSGSSAPASAMTSQYLGGFAPPRGGGGCVEIKFRVCWPFHAITAGPLLAGSPRPSPYVVTKRWRPSLKASGAATSCIDYEASVRILDEALASLMKLLPDVCESGLGGCGPGS